MRKRASNPTNLVGSFVGSSIFTRSACRQCLWNMTYDKCRQHLMADGGETSTTVQIMPCLVLLPDHIQVPRPSLGCLAGGVSIRHAIGMGATWWLFFCHFFEFPTGRVSGCFSFVAEASCSCVVPKTRRIGAGRRSETSTSLGWNHERTNGLSLETRVLLESMQLRPCLYTLAIPQKKWPTTELLLDHCHPVEGTVFPKVQAKMAMLNGGHPEESLAHLQGLAKELATARGLVVSAPMWNYGVPYVPGHAKLQASKLLRMSRSWIIECSIDCVWTLFGSVVLSA